MINVATLHTIPLHTYGNHGYFANDVKKKKFLHFIVLKIALKSLQYTFSSKRNENLSTFPWKHNVWVHYYKDVRVMF